MGGTAADANSTQSLEMAQSSTQSAEQSVLPVTQNQPLEQPTLFTHQSLNGSAEEAGREVRHQSIHGRQEHSRKVIREATEPRRGNDRRSASRRKMTPRVFNARGSVETYGDRTLPKHNKP